MLCLAIENFTEKAHDVERCYENDHAPTMHSYDSSNTTVERLILDDQNEPTCYASCNTAVETLILDQNQRTCCLT